MTQVELQTPPSWVNKRHEDLQRSYEQDREITYTYATDYGNPVDTTTGDVVKAVIGAASLYAGIALMILVMT